MTVQAQTAAMKAIQIQSFGGPEVLQMTEVPVPKPADGQLLIRVGRAGVNFADTGARQDAYLAPQQLPLIPGLEVADTVAADGDGFSADHRVLAAVANGGYAEFALAFSVAAVPFPDDVDDATATALLVQGLTAWHLCHPCGQISPG